MSLTFLTYIFFIQNCYFEKFKNDQRGHNIHKNMCKNCPSDFNVPEAELIK